MGDVEQIPHDFEVAESAFRRGFHQGYDKAIDDIMGLLHQGMNIYQAHRLMALQCNLLGVWRNEKRNEVVVPPSFNTMNLLETLEHRHRPQLESDYEEEGD